MLNYLYLDVKAWKGFCLKKDYRMSCELDRVACCRKAFKKINIQMTFSEVAKTIHGVKMMSLTNVLGKTGCLYATE